MLRELFRSPFDNLSVNFDSAAAPDFGVNLTSHPVSAMPAANFAHAFTIGDRPAPVPVTHFDVHAAPAQPQAPLLSPSMADEVSFISGINDAGQVVATSFWSWNGNKPATYAGSSDAGKFGADHATDTDVVTVHYAFRAGSHFTAEEKAVYVQCMSLWSAVTNVQFVEVATGSEDLLLKRGNDGSAYEFDSNSDSGGAGTIGGTTLFSRTHSTISLDTSVPGFGPIDGDFTTYGGYVWGTIVHEMGHALGLGHAGPYNGSVTPLTQQFSAYDTLAWSVMSYIGENEHAKYEGEYTFAADWNGNTAVTWMPLDILAIQQLYGTPVDSPLNGGDVFGFHSNVAGDLAGFFDFTVNKNPVMTIFDTGTGNTLDLSGFNKASTINLNPGTFTSADGMQSNIAIAFGTVVETAIGGKGNDTFVGSDLANTLIGNGGADTFTGGLGADSLDGGRGNDEFDFNAAAESTGAGFDTVVGVNFAAADTFDFGLAVLGVDHKVNGGALSDASFDGDLENAIGASELGAHHAVLFKVSSGDYAGETFLIVDDNNTAGYQASEDFVVMLDGAKKLGAFDIADFLS